jgi:hypothetical protein
MAHLLIHDSNQSKHGSLLNRLTLQFSMENNQRPKNVASAADVMSDHKRGRRAVSKRRAGVTPREGGGDNASSMTSSETSFAQGGKKGPISPECPDKKTIKKKDWFVCKTQLNTQAEQQQDEQEDNKSTTDTGVTICRSSDRRDAWGEPLTGIAAEKESQCNDDQAMGTRLDQC